MNEHLVLTLVLSAIISVLGWSVRALHENMARTRLARVTISLGEQTTVRKSADA